MSLSVLFMIIILQNCVNGDKLCSADEQSRYYCAWNVDGYTLNLTVFQQMGMNLTGQDFQYNYSFSPCNNLISKQMAIQYNVQKTKRLATYDSAIQPTIHFNSNSKIVWTFKYTANFSIQFICIDQEEIESYMEITKILEIAPDQFLMQISSYYVCDNINIPNDLFINQCIWYDQLQNDSVLDLTPLYGTIISSGYAMYSVCQDALYYSNAISAQICGMYTYILTAPYIYNVPWDPFIQPSLDLVTNSWRFQYDDVTIDWICDTQVQDYKVTKSSRYLMEISSQYACSAHQCLFVDPNNNENVLDLTYLEGEILTYFDGELLYSWEYSVCSNTIECDDKDVMAIRWDIKQRKCNPYLGIWQGLSGYKLRYNARNKEWMFTYTNGDICSTLQHDSNIELDIYWKCNEDGVDYNITNVNTINQCHYAMYVESKYAC
eukprot:99214_1